MQDSTIGRPEKDEAAKSDDTSWENSVSENSGLWCQCRNFQSASNHLFQAEIKICSCLQTKLLIGEWFEEHKHLQIHVECTHIKIIENVTSNKSFAFQIFEFNGLLNITIPSLYLLSQRDSFCCLFHSQKRPLLDNKLSITSCLSSHKKWGQSAFFSWQTIKVCHKLHCNTEEWEDSSM